MAEGKPITLTADNFESEVLNAGSPVLVDFWAEWCGPCKMIAPVLDELASEYEGKVTIGKVNIDHHQDLAARFNIRAIPTLLLFKGGEIQEQITGAQGKAELKSKLDGALAA